MSCIKQAAEDTRRKELKIGYQTNYCLVFLRALCVLRGKKKRIASAWSVSVRSDGRFHHEEREEHEDKIRRVFESRDQMDWPTAKKYWM